MKIRIYSLTHKKFNIPTDPLFLPLQVGREGKEDLGYLADNTGDNISSLNCYYSELTGLYWIWKNVNDIDYVGTCHYRRYLIDEGQQRVYSTKDYESLLKEYDLVTTKRVVLNNSYHYGFSANHNIEALDMTGQVIKEIYPEYYETFEELVNGPETYFGNMLVTSKEIYNAYCEWLFTIFFEVQKRINVDTDEDAYHKRVFGFISEFLLLVYVRVNGLRVKECMVGMFGEKAETKEMKNKLAEYFKNRDLDGAREYFLREREKRPDVLMEASDITGELRISMQIIATALKERECEKDTILDRENEYGKLIKLFSELNSNISLWMANHKLEDESLLKNFLKEKIADSRLISPTMLAIAKLVYENKK